MNKAISILKIEIDGHFHGGEPVKPWVAEITGPDPKYGLARRFVDAMNDWSQARRAMRGNIYGRVSHFALREGGLYEVQRCRGNSSRRRVVREFLRVTGGNPVVIEAEEALSILDGDQPGALHRIRDSRDSWVARVRGLGTPERLAWVVANGERIYRLPIGGVYEIAEHGDRRLVGSLADGCINTLTQSEAWEWIAGAAH
jgi:hypothetical protein